MSQSTLITHCITAENCGAIDDVRQLFTELEEVLDWRILGEELGVRLFRLNEIGVENRRVQYMRREMLQEWYDSTRNPQWRHVIQVLLKPSMGVKRRLAQRIAEQHGCDWEEFETSDHS